MALQSIELGPFIEGVNLVDPASKLSPKELAQCLNLRIGVRGEIYKRPGHDFYGSSPAKINGDNLVNLVLRYYKSDATKKVIVASNGKLKYGNDGTGAWTQIDIDGVGGNNMSLTNLCDWAVYKQRVYITDGVRVQRYNNTDDIYAGHYIPDAATYTYTPGVGGALSVNSAYKYAMSSVQGDLGEGPIGSIKSQAVVGAQNLIDISNIVATPSKHEPTAKKIYRTKAGGSIFYYLDTIDYAATSYQDVKADAALLTEYIPVHRPPDEARFVIIGDDEKAYWFGRTALNASLVEVSDVGFLDRIRDADGFFTVANNDNDTITGGAKIPGGLVFFKRSSMFGKNYSGGGIFGIQPREKRGGGIGTTSPFSVVFTPIGLIFLSQRGEIHLYSGTDTTIIGGVDTKDIGRTISSEFTGMTDTAMARVVACYHNYRYTISYDARGAKGYNWRTLEYDTRTGKWDGPFENGDLYNPSYYSVWDSVLDKGELYWGEAKAGNGSYLYGRTEFSKLDRGNKFISKIRSGRLNLAKLGEIVTTKFFVEGEFSPDAQLTAAHIDESGNRVSVLLNTPTSSGTTKWNDGHDWGPSGNVGKWTDIFSQTLEGSLSPARSRTPIYEISDDGTAVDLKINNVSLLLQALPLK